MRTLFFKSLWGMAGEGSTDDKLRRIKEAGYDGVEHNAGEADAIEVRDLCAKHGLEHIALIFAATGTEFVEQVAAAAKSKPILIAAHSGRDRMSFEEGCRFFDTAIRAEKDVGIPIAHETHRYRILYSPWQARPYLEKFPDLKLVADFSHWVVVCEQMLDDAEDVLALASSRAIHIHARVGYEEGPQVPDPSAPEVQGHLERFERWWDRIRDLREQSGGRDLTVTPEYGPPPYLHTRPHSGEPVANLWEVCLWVAKRLRKRWGVAAAAPSHSA